MQQKTFSSRKDALRAFRTLEKSEWYNGFPSQAFLTSFEAA